MAAEAEEFENFDWEEHVAKKGMWAGAVTKVTIEGLQGLFNGKLEGIYNDHTPAFLKSIDEGLVNITDHFYRCNATDHKVTYIIVVFSKDDGRISLENDGPGIPIKENKKLSLIEKRPIYIPEMSFTKIFSGSNMTKKADSVTGGINGVGAKIIVVNSLETTLETIDTRSDVGKRYTQTFRRPDKKLQIDPPKIEGISKGTSSKTKLTFLPAYKRLGYSQFGADEYKDIDAWLKLRLMQVAAYVGSKVKITYNGEPIVASVESLAKLMVLNIIKDETDGKDKKSKTKEGTNKEEKKDTDKVSDFPFEQARQGSVIMHDVLTSDLPLLKQYPWRIAIAISPNITKFNHMSIVNGVVCRKGTHVTVVKKIINEAVSAKLKIICKDKDKKTSVKDTCNHINIVVSAPIPGAEWTGQRKDELQMKESAINSFVFSKSFSDKLTSVIADIVLKSNPKRVKVEYEKYTAPTGKGKGNMLFAVEGDSANKMIRAGLQMRKEGIPSFEKCGIFSLQGVIMNAMKETTEYSLDGAVENKKSKGKSKEDSKSGSESDENDGDDDPENPKILIQSDRLKANKTLQALISILKLDYNKKYTSLDGLPFSSLVGCVDQDLDGSGKILPLLVVCIFMFWPELVQLGFIKRLMTPLVRVFEKGNPDNLIREFYYESEFKKWIAEEVPSYGTEVDDSAENADVDADADADSKGDSSLESEETKESKPGKSGNGGKYDIVYYKGLARHEDADIKRMFGNFDANLYTLTMQDAERELFRVYFGNDTMPRKIALKTPVNFPTLDELRAMQKSRELPCKVLLDVDTKAYKLDDIQRKIPSIVDGLNRSRRKILTGAIKRFATDNKPIKVFAFGGYVVYHVGYHQGDASLNRTIITMAQKHTSSRQYPLLLGRGYTGSRLGTTNADGVDLASARYVDVCMNTKLVRTLFPLEDRYILPYNFTDGERVEPQWFAPILPYALMDLGQLPSEGWKYKGISIHVDDIIGVVRTIIDGSDPALIEYIAKPDMKLLHALEKKYPLRLHVHGFKGEFKQIGEKMYCIGNYHHTEGEDVIYVREIPVDITISKFMSVLKSEKRAKYIEEVHNRSNDGIDIVVSFKKGALEEIARDYGNSDLDCYEDFLKLARSVTPNLNYVNHNGAVIELGHSYLGVILHWFPIRQQLYAVRINREIIILRLKLLELEYIQRYIKEYNMPGNEIKANKYKDEEVMSRILEEKKYIKLDSGLIHSPKYTPTEDLERLATKGPRIGHEYIFNLKERQKTEQAQGRNDKKMRDMQVELEELMRHLNDKPFAGAKLWKAEIDALYEVIKSGLDTNWTYRAGGKKKESGEIVKLKKRKSRAKKAK